ncbi:unnamed protein product [Linum tenue]|uniref:DYW domain-containing protein n=4 Tax=Linum tenue TaxID=586396 RepID=A0AAV0P4G5_9ROSI|nr:unnamed protein product [Linum tenue]
MATVITPASLIPVSSTSNLTFTIQHEPASAAGYSLPRTGSFKNCKSMLELKQLQSQITKTGQDQDPSSITGLISSCIEMGTDVSLDYARKALEVFVEDNGPTGSLYMFNSVIRGYSSRGFGDRAILVFNEMLCVGVCPDKYTFPFLLSGCAKAGAFREGIQAHGVIAKMGLFRDVFVQNSLIHFYAECGEIEHMRKVFDEMRERNIVSWTSLIGGYAKRNSPKEAVTLFLEMVEMGIVPNPVTLVCAISACAKLQDLELGKKVCAYIGEFGLEVNTVMTNALVDMYMKCGDIDSAKRLFDECTDKNLVLCNTMMSNYVRHGMPVEGLVVLDQMLQHGPRPDRVTMLSAISACSQTEDLLHGRSCHGYILRNALEHWDNICNALIDMYMKCDKPQAACALFNRMPNKTSVSWNSLISGFFKCGDVESAWQLFQEMPDADLVSWNTMIGALVQDSMFMEAIELFRKMQNQGVEPDRVTLMELASACGYLGAVELAKWIYLYIQKKDDIQCDLRLGTALIDMFARCGDPHGAMQVFSHMAQRDVSAWTAAIGAMAMEGNGKQAIELFNEMLHQGIKPDAVVFVNLLTALSHGGLVEEGWEFFGSMDDSFGIKPKVVHYGCMVDLLGRAGLLAEALNLIKHMPMEPNVVIWSSLLAACRMHKNVDVAKYAAEKIAQLDPERPGIHVLLSTIYASAGQWNDVAKVRLQMKEQGVQKGPGSSSVQIDGEVYEFTSGAETRPEMDRIEPMLLEMNCRLREAGYSPDLTNVLLDVDEPEKEYLLSRHSEKLAIAFSLINTGQGMPVRVVKNLRICSDCHTFAKSVSKVYNREIIIRDNNRFHFFRHGSCSCKDYW